MMWVDFVTSVPWFFMGVCTGSCAHVCGVTTEYVCLCERTKDLLRCCLKVTDTWQRPLDGVWGLGCE